MIETYVIDVWKDDQLMQSVTEKWTEDGARKLTVYYLGYYRADRTELLRERLPDGRPAQDELVWEEFSPVDAGQTILW